ncbi:hypothetical protein PV10_00790 [Exophiala mesophila]|uniref:DASH complex subunit DUO1 n=1 Tax=Exophiala mesophila TaxID=212818 RepID=A0A0D1X593_EXOME|nr:uncharacterized protein PV10_00790 [Exophiala mesophila]KIV96980.1 hypothetical protein PV10_00790 [Exophiala mesophila]
MDDDSSLLDPQSNAPDDSIWDFPTHSNNDPSNTQKTSDKHGPSGKPTYEQLEAREQELRRELEHVRKVNQAIEGVIESLGKAKNNMTTVNKTVNAASTLLNTWTRILSQTEHNQRLILDPEWQGASQDIADMEEEVQEKQRAAQRREAEEQERKNAAAKRAEEEEKRRADAMASKPTRMTTRGSSRIGYGSRVTSGSATSSTNTSYVQMGSTGTRRGTSTSGTGASRRTTTGIARGGSSRGRGSRGGVT